MTNPHPVRMSEARKLIQHVKGSTEPEVFRSFLLEQLLGATNLRYREYKRFLHKKLLSAWDSANMTKEEREAEVEVFNKKLREKIDAFKNRVRETKADPVNE